ncbi:hypothetical protein V7014_22680, partial [Bacillus sp. JJ722]
DVKPTLLHLLGIDTKGNIEFGSDVFSEDNLEFTVLRDGSFITKDYVYTREKLYDKKTGEQIEDTSLVEPYIEKAKKELELSDRVIYGDLLRFDDENKYESK